MPSLNYHHLFYFYTVARTGSMAAAAKELELTQPTISEQVRLLEKTLGRTLFDRVGRKLVLTEIGKSVFAQAANIFLLGDELTRSLHGLLPSRILRVGADPAIPAALIALALKRENDGVLDIRYGYPEGMVSDPQMQVVLTATASARTSARPLIALPTVFLSKISGKLESQRVLLPTSSPVEEIERYFRTRKIKPAIAGRCPSPDLALQLAREGFGACAAPDRKGAYPGLKVIARTDAILWRVFVVSRTDAVVLGRGKRG